MGHFVPKRQGALQRTAAQVQVTVFHAEVLSAVTFFLYGEGRGDALVEDIDTFKFNLDVSGGHLGVFGLALNHFTGCLDYEFTAEGRGCFHKFCGGIGLNYKLGDAVAVTEVNEGHAAKLAGFLDPSGEGYLLPFVFYAELPARVCSVHILSLEYSKTQI